MIVDKIGTFLFNFICKPLPFSNFSNQRDSSFPQILKNDRSRFDVAFRNITREYLHI